MENVESQGAVVVLMGNFNPAIFNPDWLARVGVISDVDLSDARTMIVHPELAQFQAGDLNFDINAQRFVVSANAEPFVRLADIVFELFKVKLPHTPITALGINYFAHFGLKDRAQQIRLGRSLAPLQPWGRWGSTLDTEDLMQSGGLISMTMQQLSPNDRIAGSINVTVQPSSMIPGGRGVYLQVNDHYEHGANEKMDIPNLLAERITPSLENSRSIVGDVSRFAESL